VISPYKIKFRNQTNIDYDLICGGAFDSDSGNTESFFNKEAVSTNIYDGSRRNVHGYNYTEVMNVSITLIKQDYSDITDKENRKIISWLTGSNKVEELTVYKDDSEVISYRLIGNVTNIEQYKLANNRVVGYVINFENISPYAFSPVRTITKTIITPETFTLKCRSDVYEKHLFPRITMALGESIYLPINEDPMADTFEMLPNTVYEYTYYTTSEDGTQTQHIKHCVKIGGQKHTLSICPTNIENQTADASTVGTYCLSVLDKTVYQGVVVNNAHGWKKVTVVGAGFEITSTYYEDGHDVTVKSTVTDCYANEIITFDGDNKLISSSRTPMRIIGDSFNWEWLYLIPGDNSITISGSGTVVFEWVEPIKIGNL
jgi:hypothetical protein